MTDSIVGEYLKLTSENKSVYGEKTVVFLIFGKRYSKTKGVKRTASPKVIGAFVSAILILLLAMVAFLGKNSLFTRGYCYLQSYHLICEYLHLNTS